MASIERAVLYSLGLLEVATSEVVTELRRKDVALAVVVDESVTPSASEDPKVLDVVKAEDLVVQLTPENVQDLIGRLRAEPGGLGAKRPGFEYRVRFKEPARVTVRTRFAEEKYRLAPSRIKLPGSTVYLYDMVSGLSGPSGIRLAGPSGNRPPVRYRCDDPKPHIVWRTVGSDGETCGEQLPDGTECLGTLKRY